MSNTQIEEDAVTVLRALAEYQEAEDDPNRGHHELSGPQLQEITQLPPHRLNDAAELLSLNSNVLLRRYIGTHPFTFGFAVLQPLGRYEYQRLMRPAPPEAVALDERVTERPSLPRRAVPVGSPYGFTDLDWEYVDEQRRRSDCLVVVFGFQFESETYESDRLISNVQAVFEAAVDEYNQEPGHSPISLDFRSLRAGYGEHLFNEIARDIISSDIAVFETSDMNPNVMIEMGVALTWGTRVLPIKEERKPKPPSDISGQTWADYRDSAAEFVAADHKEKLIRMIDRAMQKKYAQ